MLPAGGANKFQKIKQMCKEAEGKGMKIYRLSIGQPSGPALASARMAASKAVLSNMESMHEYQDNGSPGVPDFAKRFVAAHFPREAREVNLGKMSFLPIPGIKPMLGLIPLACGGSGGDKLMVATMTKPGYPTPADQCNYQGHFNYALATNPGNEFLFPVENIEESVDLLMLNYPHNPSGQVASVSFWHGVCRYCEEHDIRVFNDAAYAALAHNSSATMLAEIAPLYPDLSWAEALSASKVIGNGTGWRIGAICGSEDFVSDIATIKGNTDSGFFAPAAQGVITSVEEDQRGIAECREVYARRINFINNLLEDYEMRLAVEPRAGFFTLWMSPRQAFGQDVKDAEEFNNLMIANTGIVGVPFGEYIRYAVTSDIESWEKPLRDGFKKARVAY